jgi:uncharacterized protein
MNSLSRRSFVKKTVAAGAGSILLSSNLVQAGNLPVDPEPSLKGKKVLYVWGGWDGHEPKQSIDVFVPWLRLKVLKLLFLIRLTHTSTKI